MKRFILILLALLFLTFGLFSCKDDNQGEETSEIDTTEDLPVEENSNEFGRDNEVWYDEEWKR